MKIEKTLMLGFISCFLLCGCALGSNKDDEQIRPEDGILSDKDSVGEMSENTFLDTGNEILNTYPELNTTEVAFMNYGFGPIVVSPYINDDIIRALTHVICENDISVYCYHNYLYDEYSEDFSAYDFERAYDIIKARVETSKSQADAFNKQFCASLENDAEIHISPDGEYYYILDMGNFDESASAIKNSVDMHAEAFNYDMQFESEYYFENDGREFLGGYRGITYSIYLNSYSNENKIYEYYYWKSKNQWLDVYSDLYNILIYDFTVVEDDVNSQTGTRYQLSCFLGTAHNTESGLYQVNYNYHMWEDEFDPESAIENAYEVYTNVRTANEEYNTHRIVELYIHIYNFTSYNEEYQELYVCVPIEEEYSFDEFEKLLMDQVEIVIEDEPV